MRQAIHGRRQLDALAVDLNGDIGFSHRVAQGIASLLQVQ
jgi:hypothetical protein